MNTTSINVIGDKGTSYEVTPKRTHYHRTFSKIGRLNTLREATDQPDLLDLLASMSKGARDLLVHLKNHMNTSNNVARITSEGLSKGQINKRSCYARELSDLGIIRKLPSTGIKDLEDNELRFSAVSFILSPAFFVPSSKEQGERIDHIWHQVW